MTGTEDGRSPDPFEADGQTSSVSVAMATFNGAPFLQAQLDSLAQQELQLTELVVCDDRSTDETPAILHRFAGRAPFPVRVVVNEVNLGWRANFMQAAGLCLSPLIAFCDQDDVWYPRKLKVAAALLDDPATLLVHHDADLIDRKGTVLGTLRADQADTGRLPPLSRPVTWECPLGLTLIFRRSLLAFSPYWLASIDPVDPRFPAAHDQWFYALAASLGVVRFSSDRLLAYRQHGGNVVGFDPAKRLAASLARGHANAQLEGGAAMLRAFCAILARAQADQTAPFEGSLLGAIAFNEGLLKAIDTLRTLRKPAPVTYRVGLLIDLVRQGAYSRSTPWSFGYRSLLADACKALLS